MTEVDAYKAPRDDDGRIEVARDIGLGQLESLLLDHGIPLELWGKGQAKTVASLKKEIEKAESSMWVDDDGNLHRDVRVLWVDVIHQALDGSVYVLREDRQEFKDGRKRERTLPGSLGEKLELHEDPHDAVARALLEEIGVDEFAAHYVIGEDESIHAPPTYPGLVSKYSTYSHVVTIDQARFNPDGYVEYQDDKTNYYVWDKLTKVKDDGEVLIRTATAYDREQSVALYKKSQAATGHPQFIPAEFLEHRLYEGPVVKRYVAERHGIILGHGLVERPNPHNVDDWTYGTDLTKDDLLELGRAFVDPDHAGEGIGTRLLEVRLKFITDAGKVAVAATWFDNVHVMRMFERLGGVNVGDKSVTDGIISMYRFDDVLIEEDGQEVAVVGVDQDQEQDEVEEQMNAQ